MTKILLADDYAAFTAAPVRAADIRASRFDRAVNLVGGLVLLPGLVLGAVMFVAQSL